MFRNLFKTWHFYQNTQGIYFPIHKQNNAMNLLNHFAKNIAGDISIKGENYSAFTEADDSKKLYFVNKNVKENM